MSSFQNLLAGISTYFKKQETNRQERQAGLELSSASTNKTTKAQRETARKKDISKIKGMVGELQRSDLGLKVSDIETNFYKQSLSDLANKKQEAEEQKAAAMSRYMQVKQKHEEKLMQDEPQETRYFFSQSYKDRYGSADLSDPKKILDLFKTKNEMMKKGFRSAARWMRANWEREESPLYQAYLQANEIERQQDFSKYYTQQSEETQRNLQQAEQTAITQFEAAQAPLENIRQQTINTLGREIKERETTPSIGLLTETKEGPSKTQPKPRVKDKLKRVEQPSLFEGRPQ